MKRNYGREKEKETREGIDLGWSRAYLPNFGCIFGVNKKDIKIEPGDIMGLVKKIPEMKPATQAAEI